MRPPLLPSFLLLLLAAVPARSQAAAPAPAAAWTHKLVGDVTANQVALKDWAQGGDDAFAWGVSLNGASTRAAGRAEWSTAYKLAFGQNKLGDQAIRKTVDRLEIESALTWDLGRYVDPYGKVTLKTQSFRSYRYADTTRTAVAGFFDPAYLTQSAGAGVRVREQVKTKAGLALRQIITRDFNSYSDRKSTREVEEVRIDGGLESVTDVEWQLADNIQMTSKLEIFLPLTEPGDTSVGNDAALAVKLSEYITLNVNFRVLRDPTSSDDVQLKQTTALGLRYSLF